MGAVGGRPLFWQMMTSLDGRYAGPAGELDWHAVDAEFNDYVLHMLDSIDTIVMGRRTWEELGTYWPTATSPEAPRMNDLEKVVFSGGELPLSSWENSRHGGSNAVAEVARLRSLPGRGIGLFGSNRLAEALLGAGLVDEVRILLCPVVLGEGPLLLEGLAERLPLHLVASRTLASGLSLLSYSPLRETRPRESG